MPFMGFDEIRARLEEVRSMVLEPLAADFPPNGLPAAWREDDVRLVLNSGLADFAQGGQHAGVDYTNVQRALFYVRRNMATHLDELVPLFRTLFEDAADEVRANGLTLVDFGAGPFTAGLAAAAVFEDRLQPMHYFGIEIAEPMRNVAHDVIAAARRRNLLFEDENPWLGQSAALLPRDEVRTSHLTVVVASYLFANAQFQPDRDLKPLLDWLDVQREHSDVYIISLNTTNPAAQKNIERVVKVLGSRFLRWHVGAERLLNSRDTQVLVWRRVGR